jgi:DNA-directed RNA polymerase, mitochondrial
MATETDLINKHKARNTIAPSFVHSLDACHLHKVVLACKDEGINDLALVHDSFGCLAADADDMRRILKEQFYDLYENNDVLADILREACEQLHTSWHKLPNVPERGTYEISNILNAEFAFA